MQNIEEIRKSADASQNKANDLMKNYMAKKNLISDYEVGEEVLVCNDEARTRNGRKRKLDKLPSLRGRVLEKGGKNRKNLYKVQYQQQNGQSVASWIPVTRLTSEYKSRKKIS